MNFWSLVIAAAIFILPSLLSGKKQSGKKAAPAAPAKPAKQNTKKQPKNSSVVSPVDAVELDDLGQPFFSYESEDVKSNKAYRPVNGNVDNGFAKSDKTIEEVQSMPLTLDGEEFDLRKAIVYQTILQRVNA